MTYQGEGIVATANHHYVVLIDNNNALRYYVIMIKSFADKNTEIIWNRQWINSMPKEVQRVAYRKLIMLHRAISLNDLRVPPGNRLEKLSGDRSGEMSIRINKQYRICFIWTNGDAYEVQIIDYH